MTTTTVAIFSLLQMAPVVARVCCSHQMLSLTVALQQNTVVVVVA